MIKRHNQKQDRNYQANYCSKCKSWARSILICLKCHHIYGGNLSRRGWLHSGILIIALGCASKEQNASARRQMRCFAEEQRFSMCVCKSLLLTYSDSLRWKPCCIWSRCSSADAVLCSFISSHSWRIFRNATRPLLVCARCEKTYASVFVSFWKILAFKVPFYKSWKCPCLQHALEKFIPAAGEEIF